MENSTQLRRKGCGVLKAAVWGAALSMVFPALGYFFRWLGGPPPQWLGGVAMTLELPALVVMQVLGIRNSLVAAGIHIATPALAFALVAAFWQFIIKGILEDTASEKPEGTKEKDR